MHYFFRGRLRSGGSGVLALLLLFATGSGQPAAAQQAAACQVTHLVGSAILLRAGASLPLAPGTPLHEDDQVVTDRNARLGIACLDGSTLVIGESSNVSLSTFAALARESGGSVVLDLLEGILRLALSPESRRERFEVKTPTAIAAVRSTEWITEAATDNTAVFVIDGRVAVRSRAGEGQVLLQPGFGTDVPRGAAPTEPKRWGQPRVDSALSRTSLP
jgi:hypothetical protein